MESTLSHKLPFRASGKIPLNLSVYDLIIEISGQEGREFAVDAENAVVGLVDAGQAGMIPAEGIPPQNSAMELLSHEQIAADKFRFICRVQNIDLAAYRMFFNMLAQLHQLTQPWQHVHLDYSPAASESLSVDDSRIGQVHFPKRWSPLPFSLVLDELGSQGDRRTIRLEFAQKLEAAHFEAVSAALENWTFLMLLGAYWDSFEVMKDFSVAPGEIYMIDACTVEQTLRAFRAPEIVFEAVINFAAKQHFSLLPVVSLEII